MVAKELEVGKVNIDRTRVAEAMREVVAEGNRVHVIPSQGKWVITRENAKRATKAFDVKREAVERGRVLAEREGGELVVHGRDGRIQEYRSYKVVIAKR